MSGQRTQTPAYQTLRSLLSICPQRLLNKYRSVLASGSLADTGSYCSSHHYYDRRLPYMETQA